MRHAVDKKLFLALVALIAVNCVAVGGQRDNDAPGRRVVVKKYVKFSPTGLRDPLDYEGLQEVPERRAQPAPTPLVAPRLVPSPSRAQGVAVDGSDLKAEAGHHGHQGHNGFFQYARVPHHGAWEFGFRRGNPGHFKERHEQGKGHHFRTKVRWGDRVGGYGEHYYDYNHAPKHHHGHHHHGKHHHAAGKAKA